METLGRHSAPEENRFRLALHETEGILRTVTGKRLVSSHIAGVCFTRFFPCTPIEVNLETPIFHPNVDPKNGFVCLWRKFSAVETVLEVLRRLQRIVTWSWVNLEIAHVLQPDAVHWYQDAERKLALPLSFRPLTCPKDYLPGPEPSDQVRRRLERIPY